VGSALRKALFGTLVLILHCGRGDDSKHSPPPPPSPAGGPMILLIECQGKRGRCHATAMGWWDAHHPPGGPGSGPGPAAAPPPGAEACPCGGRGGSGEGGDGGGDGDGGHGDDDGGHTHAGPPPLPDPIRGSGKVKVKVKESGRGACNFGPHPQNCRMMSLFQKIMCVRHVTLSLTNGAPENVGLTTLVSRESPGDYP